MEVNATVSLVLMLQQPWCCAAQKEYMDKRQVHVQVYPTTNLVHTPRHCDMVCLHDLAAGAPADHSFLLFSWHLANPRWWDDLGIAPFHPTIPP